MANAGHYGVNIGTGAAGGAATGAAFGPWGALIGGGVGAIGGALSTLLQSSDEAKQKEKARQALMQQQREAATDDWDRRFASITGLSGDPMYTALGYEPYSEGDAQRRANQQIELSMPERSPDYGQLVGALGSLGGTVGGQVRAGDLASRRQEMGDLNAIGGSGNAWAPYAQQQEQKALEELLEKSREAAWKRTGGW